MTTDPFKLTTGRWFNKLKPSGKYAKAPAYHQGFRYTDFAYGGDYPEHYQPAEAPLQMSAICAPSTFALGIDVDDALALPDSATGALIDASLAFSKRDDHFHVLVDMRGVEPGAWPQQGRTAWGDIKAAGFIPLPGSVHYSGARYEVTENRPVEATPELIAALKADRLACARDRLAQAATGGNPRVAGVRLDDGSYIFASGYVAGSWAQLPDGFLRHDDELKDLAWDMGLRGLDEAVVLSEWQRLAGADDSGDPWTDRDFARHWRNIPAAVQKMTARADADERSWDALGFTADVRAAVLARNVAPDEDWDENASPEPPPSLDLSLAEQTRAWVGAWEFSPRGDTDSADAEDTLARNYPISRYSPAEDVWLARGLDRWRIVPSDQADGLVENLVPLMDIGRRGRSLKDLVAEGADAANLTDDQRERIILHEKRKKFGNSGSSAGIARKIRAKLKSPMPNPYWTDPADLDRDAYALWAGGVAWDLRASDSDLVQRAEPSNFVHLHSARYRPLYSPDMAKHAPLFTKLTNVIWPDQDVRDWALNVLAVGLTGSPRKVLPVLRGEKDSGKTTIAQALLDVLGTYGGVVNRKLFDGDANTHDTIIMDLMGLRLAYLDEGLKKGQMARDRLKNIAGGGDLIGHRMRKDSVRFRATHTLVMSANPDEEPPLDDPAIRSRIRWVPCQGDPEKVIAAARQLDYFSAPAWREEAPYVLGYMIVRCASVLKDERVLDKDQAPWVVQESEQSVAEQQDEILQWFKEATLPEPHGYSAEQLYISFRDRFTRLHGPRVPVPSITKWGRRMNQLIPEDGPNSGTRLISSSNTVLRRARPRPESFFGLPLPVPSGNPPATLSREDVVIPDSTDSTDSMPTRTHTRAHTRINSGDTGGEFNPPEVTGLSGERAAPVPHGTPKSATQGNQEQAAPAAGKPAPPKREKAEVPHPDPALEGPVYPLPVIVARRADGEIPWVLPCSPEQARLAAEPYLDHLSVDCETTGYPPGHADFALRTVQLGGEQATAVLDPADPAQAAVISDLLDRARMLHAHSAAADLVPLAAMRLGDRDMLWAKMTDSVLVVKLADPALAGSDENELKKLAAALLPGYAVSPAAEKAKNALFKSGKWLVKTAPLTPPEKSGWAQVKPGCETMARYAGSDVLDLAAVLRVLPPPDERVLAREREFQAMCARVAHDGFRLDPAHIAAKTAEHIRVRDECRAHVQALCPDIDNPSSTAQVPAALAELGVPLGVSETTGRASAAKPELERLAADESYEHHELLRAILDYRHHVTTLGLLLEPLGVLCSRGDGRMRPVVYTINADTGRTSCVRPNGQQFSRQGGIRACVIADEGMAGISADFAGVEIRVAAALSGDADLLRAETEGDGLHWMAARMAWGADATKENRYAAKRIIFSKLFGGSATAGARQTGVSRDAAQAVHQAFEAIAPRYAAWDREMRTYVSAGNRGFPAYSGRVIWLPRGRAHAAGNYAIQGSARELLVDGALRWGRTRWGHHPLLPIHDELLTFVPAAEAEEALETLKTCMAGSLNGVPIKAEGTGPFPAWPDSS